MKKKQRQQALAEIIRTKNLRNQNELKVELAKIGIESTQSSISRDLIDLNVTKLRGTYRLPPSSSESGVSANILQVEIAGDNLIIIKTPPGQASMRALVIDREKIPEVVGTVAGDDTFFVAVKSRADQTKVIKQIFKLICLT